MKDDFMRANCNAAREQCIMNQVNASEGAVGGQIEPIGSNFLFLAYKLRLFKKKTVQIE
jgi:hypothetical protein